MSENSSQDKTEKASPQKLRKARKEGQVARSKELTASGLLVFGGLAMFWFVPAFADLFRDLVWLPSEFDWQGMRDPNMMLRALGEALWRMMWTLIPLFAVLGGLMVALSALPGGFVLVWKSLLPKFSKLNPLSGLKRMFSANSLMELFKSSLKVVLLGGTLGMLLQYNWPRLLMMNRIPLGVALEQSLHILALAFIILGCVMLIVAFIDAPYQQWTLMRKLKMSKQEVKDEHKNSEGSPEIKRRIRQIQMAMTRASIDRRVPKADVIIVNPTHYAVAIQYDPKRANAPFVIAKGVDGMALRIREVAMRHAKMVLELPPLTRAIYYSTRIDQEVPAGLYAAVAYVLNYVLQLQAYQHGRGLKPRALPDLPIPPELHQPER